MPGSYPAWSDWPDRELAAHLTTDVVQMLRDVAGRIVRRDVIAPNIWDRDISGELATNPGPYENAALQRDGGWWQRRLDQIDKVTFHHTLSNSPHATASHYVNKGGGRPTIPYTLWVTQTGEILRCVPLEFGLWHDHTGHENTHLSVGLAGSLHIHAPADVQLDAAARVADWAIRELPGVTGIGDITGHRDWTATTCPGWESPASGLWKQDLYDRIEAL